jgi:hypothetical protein
MRRSRFGRRFGATGGDALTGVPQTPVPVCVGQSLGMSDEDALDPSLNGLEISF